MSPLVSETFSSMTSNKYLPYLHKYNNEIMRLYENVINGWKSLFNYHLFGRRNYINYDSGSGVKPQALQQNLNRVA